MIWFGLEMDALFQYRKYEREMLDKFLGTGGLPVFEQFLENQGFPIEYPVGWILGYFNQMVENPVLLKNEIERRVDRLSNDGCTIVFALLEWGEHSERDEGIAKSAALFSELGWSTSAPFAATERGKQGYDPSNVG